MYRSDWHQSRLGGPGSSCPWSRRETGSLVPSLRSAPLCDARKDRKVFALRSFLMFANGLMKKHPLACLFLTILLNLPAEKYKMEDPKSPKPAS